MGNGAGGYFLTCFFLKGRQKQNRGNAHKRGKRPTQQCHKKKLDRERIREVQMGGKENTKFVWCSRTLVAQTCGPQKQGGGGGGGGNNGHVKKSYMLTLGVILAKLVGQQKQAGNHRPALREKKKTTRGGKGQKTSYLELEKKSVR